jgi:hypothetical protein
MNSKHADKFIRDGDRIEEANRRLEILNAVKALVEGRSEKGEVRETMSERKACLKVGVNQATFGRWKKRFDELGFNGLLPETDKCGNTSTLEKLNVPESVVKKAQGILLDTQSETAAWRSFASSDECPENLARVILDPTKCSKHALPPSLRRAIKITEPVMDHHRGDRQRDLNGLYIPRKVDILPGDIFTADDTTPIWGWWVPWVESEEYPFGVKLLQGQFLPVMDIASQCAITFVLIAREKSSYRASDIWSLFGHTFETIGLPRLGWQLERGSWESNIIRGVEVAVEEGEVSISRRVGGLRQLPTNLTPFHVEKLGDAAACFPKTLQTWTSYLPKSKSIEAFFNRSQTLEGMLWGSLGRDQMRAPFERTKKIFQACQRGSEDPRNHFLSHTEIAARLIKNLDYLNHEPMEGEVFHGIPRVKFDQAVRENPLFRFPEEERWLYRRNWKVLQITKGWARVRLTDELTHQRYSLHYGCPQIFGQIEGAQVVVYYDREKFEEPAQILAAQKVQISGQTFEPGEFICEAQYFDRVGSFLEGDRTGHDIRKLWKNAVLSTYATLVSHAPSRQLPAEIEARRKESREEGKPSTINHQPSTPSQIDGRPAAQPVKRGFQIERPTPEQAEARRINLAKQAAHARESLAMSNE